MTHWKRTAAALAALLLAACAQQPLKPAAPAAEAEKAAEIEGHESLALYKETEDLPKQELTEELLYQFLLAEVAGQRGNLQLASQTYLKIAQATRDLRLAQRATEIALYSRQPQLALEGAQLWLELSPNSFRARQIISSLLINGGRPQDAVPHLEKLLGASGENVGHAFAQINALFARYPDKAEVLGIVKGLAQGYEQVAESHYAVAQAAYNAEDNPLALEQVRAALKLQPDWETAAIFQSQILFRSGGSAAAGDYLRRYLQGYPKAKDARLNLARLYAADRNYTQARGEFQKLLEEFPDNADVMLAIGMLSQRLRDYDSAERQFKRLLELDYRESDSVRLYLGQLSETRKRNDEALDWYGSVEPGATQYYVAQAKYAIVMARQGKAQAARERLRQLVPQNNQQRVQLIQAEAQILREQSLYQESFDLLARSLEKLPNYPELLYDYAMAAEKIDRLDLLESTLRKLIQLQPDNAHAYNGLGYTLADRTERQQEALELIEKALQLAPDDSAIIDSMGWVQYRLGKVKQSLQYLRRAYDDSRDPEIAAHLGEALWADGQRQAAEKIWRESLQDNPGHPVLLNVLKKFLP